MEVDLEGLGCDVRGGYVRIDARVHANRSCSRTAFPGELGHGLAEKLHVELEAERRDVTVLLGAEQVAGTTDLEVAHRDREARAELRVVGERRQARPRLRGQLARVRIEEVGGREQVRAAAPPAGLGG